MTLPIVISPVEAQNLLHIADYLGFNDREKEFLLLLYVLSYNGELSTILEESLRNNTNRLGAALGRIFNDPEAHGIYAEMANEAGRLFKYGIIGTDEGSVFPHIHSDIYKYLSLPNLAEKDLFEKLVGRPVQTDLDLDDFSYLGKDLDLLVDRLEKAVAEGEEGFNVLIYGPAGGGKTELAKAISKHLGKKIYAAGEQKGGGSRTSRARLAHLYRLQALLEGNTGAVVFFDEIEDLLIKGTDSEKKADTENKVENQSCFGR